jgi:nitroreductase
MTDDFELRPEREPPNEIFKNIYERRSIRNYRPDAVPDDAIKEIIRAGTFAPSAMDTQPWRFVVIRNREMIKKLSDKAKELWVEQSKNMQSLDLQRLADMVSRPISASSQCALPL